MMKLNGNRYAICNHALFGKEYIKRRVLWDRSASFPEKAQALSSMAAALGVNMNPRALYSCCIRFRKVHEKKVHAYLLAGIKKQVRPELALKQAGVLAWVREVESELHVLPRLIQQFRTTGLLPPEDRSHVMWSEFVNKMADHCHTVRRLPSSEDIATVVDQLGLGNNSFNLWKKLWHEQSKTILYKYRCLSESGDRPSELVALTQLEWKVVDLIALYMTRFSVVYDFIFKEKVDYEPEVLHMAIETVLSKEMGVTRASKYYLVPQSTLAYKVKLLKSGKELPKGTLKSNIQVKQLVKLYHLVKMYRIEENDSDEQMKQKWAMIVRSYSRCDETSPSGIILQMRWHELKSLARKNILRRIQDKNCKVHPLMVEIATKYPHIMKDSHTWAGKVHSGNVYDVTNVPIKMDYYYSVEESEERPTNEQVLDKNAEVDSDFDSDEERPLVIADNATPVASTSKKRTKSTEFSMPRLDADEDPNKTKHDQTNVNNSPVDNLRNKELTRLDDELSSQLRSIIAGDISKVDSEINHVTDKIEKKIDIMDEELEKLSKEFNKQFNALKNLNSRTNSNLGKSGVSTGNKDVATKTKSKGESNSELSKDNQTINYNTTEKCNKQCGPKKPCTVTVLENNVKLPTKTYKRKKDDGNTNPEIKSELPNNKLLPDGIIATIYTCKAPDGSELGHVVVPTPINKDSVTLTVKTNDGPVTFNSAVINNPQTGNIDVPKENDSLNTSKESDLDLLQKIDPAQAETVLIFSDSDNEESDLPKPNENAQDSKKVYNLNDVKKYLSSHSLDDILMKMDDINVKKVNRRSASYIHLSDSDEEAKGKGKHNASDEKIFSIDDSDVSINEEDSSPKDDNVVSVIPNENSSLLIPNLNVPTNTKIIAFNVKSPDSNATNVEVSVKVERDFEDYSNNQIRDDFPSSKVRKKTLDAKEDTEALPAGLNLFRLQDRQSKETLGVLVNVKNSMKTSELGIQLSKKVDEYLNGSTDNDSIENRNKPVNDNNEYYNVINKKLGIEKVNKWTDVLLKKALDSSSTKPLWTSEIQEKNNEEENDDEGSSKTFIDPKLIMDARVYLPKLDEVQTYNKNRRSNFSINLKRISILGNKILNYKRKSDDPIRIQDDIESEISEGSKRKATDALDNIKAKRIRKSSDDTSIITPYNPNSVTRKTDSNLATNIVQRIKFESDDDSLSNGFEHTINDLENNHEKNNVYVKTENAQTNDTSLNEHIIDIRKMLPGKDINMTSDDNENSNYGSDAMELDDTIQNNTLLLDATNSNNPHEKESNNINSENINSKLLEFINDTNHFRFDNTKKDKSNKQNLTENKIAKNRIDNKLNETNNRLTVLVINVDENNETNVENDPNKAQETSSDDDIDLKTINNEEASSLIDENGNGNVEEVDSDEENGNGNVEEVDSDDNDPGPINNIAEMLKLCKPVKLCLERVKVPTDNIQVRKVELPDRTSLKRHRAPTAHVAPISVTLPLDCDTNDGKATESQLGTLLQQLSMETASEWQRLEESVKNTSQVKRPRLHDHTYTRDRKEKEKSCKKEDKKQKKIVIKSKTPDPDELRLQNKEWERQKTMNNRFFDLTPKYKRPTVVPAKGEKDAKEKLNKTEHSLPKKPDEETPRIETEMAIASLINDLNNDTPKNNDSNNAKSDEKHDSYDVIKLKNTEQSLPKKPDEETPRSETEMAIASLINDLNNDTPKNNDSNNAKSVEKHDSYDVIKLKNTEQSLPKKPDEETPRSETEMAIASLINDLNNDTPKNNDSNNAKSVEKHDSYDVIKLKNTEQSLPKKPDEETPRSETEMAIASLTNDFNNDTPKNNDININDNDNIYIMINAKSVEKHDSYDVITFHDLNPLQEVPGMKTNKPVSTPAPLSAPQESVNVNVLTPLFTKVKKEVKNKGKKEVEKKEKEVKLVPIPTKVTYDDSLLTLKMPRRYTEAKSNEQRSHTDKSKPGTVMTNKEQTPVIPSTSKDAQSNLLPSTSKIAECHYISDDSGPAFEKSNTVNVKATIDETPGKQVNIKDLKQATKHKETSVKKSRRQIKSKTLQPVETITLSDSDTDTASQTDYANVVIDKFEIQDEQIQINVNPPIKVMESTLTKTGSKHILKMMEIGPINDEVLKKIDNLLNKGKDTPKRVDGSIIKNISSIIDLGDSSDEDKDDKNNHKLDSVTPEFSKAPLESQENVITGQMPQITSVTSIGSSIDITSKKNSGTNPINSDDEYFDSDSDELYIDENPTIFNKGKENVQTESEFSSPIKLEFPEPKITEIKSLSVIKNNIQATDNIATSNIKSTENVPIDPKTVVIDIINLYDEEPSIPPLSNTENDIRIQDNCHDSTGTNIPSIDVNVLPENNNDNINSDCGDNSKIDENNSNSIADSKSNENICSNDADINEEVKSTEENEITDANNEDLTLKLTDDNTNIQSDDRNYPDQKCEIININKDETIANKNDETFENKKGETIDNKKDETIHYKCDETINNKKDETIDNKKDETINNKKDETIDFEKDKTIDNKTDETIDNKKDETIENKKDESIDSKTVETNDKTDETVDNKKDETNDNIKDDKPTDNDPKPRSFLKLVPIQKLLGESKVEPKITNEPKIFEDTLAGVENSECEDDLFSKDVSDTLESKMRGEPIPFLCSTKSDVTEVSNLPTISNVVSLSSGGKKPVLQTITNPEKADLLTAKKSMTKPVMLSKVNLKFFLDNPSSSSDERLKSWEISTQTPILVTDFIKNRDSTNISLLCIDESKPLWKVYIDYLIVTNLKLPLQEPSYWSMGGRRTRAKIVMDDNAKGSTVVGELSIPDEIFLDNHWYRKLSTEPMIYAKVWFVVPNSKTCLDMINLDMDMQLFSNNTGAMTPMFIQKGKPNIAVKKTVIKFLPVGDKSKVTDSGEVISLDSDDE